MKKTITCVIAMVFLIAGSLYAQESREITGKIKSDKGEPVIGATVLVKGTALGTKAKTDGSFTIRVPKSNKTLIFKSIGFKTKEVILGSETNISVTLEEDVVQSSGVVVTAMGLERDKKTLNYATDEVSSLTLSKSAVANVGNALSGNVSGVSVNNSAGTPGASTFVTIRGVTSLKGENQPLWVIDGVPMDNSMDYSGNPDDGSNNLLQGVAYSNRAIDIDPNDIESMTVLKGPTATALYGLRAASGAIIITTKKGLNSESNEKINITFNSSLSIDKVSNQVPMQMQYAQGDAGKYYGPGTGSKCTRSWGPNINTLTYDPTVANPYDKHGAIVAKTMPGQSSINTYDNVGDFFATGYGLTNSLSMAGGSDIGNFYLSLSNLKQSGVVPKSLFERTSVRLNGEAKIFSKLKASGNFNYINSGGTRIQQGSNRSGVMLGLLRTAPTFDNSNGYGNDAVDNPDAYFFADGTQRTYRGAATAGAPLFDNPYFTVNRNPFTDRVDRFLGNFQLTYMANEWLDVSYRLGADIYSDKRKQIFDLTSGAAPAGQVFNHELFVQDLNGDLLVTLKYPITEYLSSKLVLGQNMTESYSSSLYAQGDGLVIPNFFHISNAASSIVRQSWAKMRTMAFYGNLLLDYKSWLFFDGSLRNEQSTTLPEDENSFLYGSAGISFVFTEAFKDIFEKTPLTYGKFRTSFAVVGKDAPVYSLYTPYLQESVGDGYTDGVKFPFSGIGGFVQGSVLGNDKLKPEKTSSYEIGFELNFWQDLFGVDFTYYNSTSKDQILTVPLASSSGFFQQVMNAGEISNKGIELTLKSTPYKDRFFKYDVALNFSKNTNTVEKLAPGVDRIRIQGFASCEVRAEEGSSYGTIYGYGWLRNKDGAILVDDDGYPILDQSQQKALGNVSPDWNMGFRNTFNYTNKEIGDFSLSVMFDIKHGGKMWNGTKGMLYYYGTHEDTQVRETGKMVFDGVVQSTGQKNTKEIPLDQNWFMGVGGGSINAESFIEDAGWVRLREVTFSYQLPKSIVSNLGLSGIGFSFTGRNLWISTDYTGVDPETSLMGAFNAQGLDYFNMPGTRTYTFSLNINF